MKIKKLVRRFAWYMGYQTFNYDESYSGYYDHLIIPLSEEQ